MITERDQGGGAFAAPGELLRRAYSALVQQGAALPAETLAQAVFNHGTTPVQPVSHHSATLAPATPWLMLLDRLLGDSNLFQKQDDGLWRLAEWNAEDLPLDSVEFVVLDVETTGLSPARHRLIEVAAIIVQGGQTRDVYQKLINPGKRIPDFIAKFTGITSEMVVRAPRAEQVLPELMNFIGRRPIVGHNVSFDLNFLGCEAERGHWFFASDGIDTITMARRFIEGLRRVKLDVLAARLGVSTRDRHRALGDAQTTADVFHLLLVHAQAQGARTLADLRLMLGEMAGKKSTSRETITHARPTGSMYLNPAWRRDFPAKPGVYLMRDEVGTVIYVGKAKVLKERLASYYNHPLGYTRKMDGLLQSVHTIETRVLGSELEALLVESQLIKKLQPRYNVQLRNYEQYPFIKVDVTADYPKVTATREVHADGARYFGPFNSRRAVDATIEVIQKIFPVRTCTRSLPPRAKPSDPCLRYHMGRCSAPCRGGVAKESYRVVIDDVIEFMAQSRGDMMDVLRQRMWEAAERDDFERAAALRDVIHHADHVLLGQKLITTAIEANNLMLVYPSAEPEHVEIFLVRHGRLVEQRRVAGTSDAIEGAVDELTRRAIWLGPVPKRVGKAEVDQINIIARWVHRHTKDLGRAFFTLPLALDDSEVSLTFRSEVVSRTLEILAGVTPESASTEENTSSTEGELVAADEEI